MSMWMMRRCVVKGAIYSRDLQSSGEEPQAAGERGKHRGAEFRAHLDELEEGLLADRLHGRVGLRGCVRDARGGGVDQGRLAERAARAEALDDASADRDPHLALDDRVHAQAL